MTYNAKKSITFSKLIVTYLMNLRTLLLELFVALSHDLNFFLALVLQQILQVFPEIDHLARAELRTLIFA